MASRVDPILRMNLNGDDGEEVTFSDAGVAISNPYQQYAPDTAGGGDDRSVKPDKASRPKSGKRASSTSRGGGGDRDRGDAPTGSGSSSGGGSSRPKSAARRRAGDEGGSGNMTARGK